MNSDYERGFSSGYWSGSFFYWMRGLENIINHFRFAKIREENERIMRYNAQVDYVNEQRHKEMERLGVEQYFNRELSAVDKSMDAYNLWVQEENARIAAAHDEAARHGKSVSCASGYDGRNTLMLMADEGVYYGD